jgi:hypothetical protein
MTTNEEHTRLLGNMISSLRGDFHRARLFTPSSIAEVFVANVTITPLGESPFKSEGGDESTPGKTTPGYDVIEDIYLRGLLTLRMGASGRYPMNLMGNIPIEGRVDPLWIRVQMADSRIREMLIDKLSPELYF